MDSSIIGVMIFLAAFVFSRVINERAIRDLTDAEKGRLLGGFSRFRLGSLVGVVVLVVGYFVADFYYPGSPYASLPVFAGVLIAYMLGASVIVFGKLKRLGLPDTYINRYLLGAFIQFLGIFALFAASIGKGIK